MDRLSSEAETGKVVDLVLMAWALTGPTTVSQWWQVWHNPWFTKTDLTKFVKPNVYPCFFVSSLWVVVCPEWVYQMNVPEWVWCHASAPGQSWVKLSSCLQRLCGVKALREPMGRQNWKKTSVKGLLKEHWAEHISEIYNRNFTSCWWDGVSNFNDIVYGGFSRSHSIIAGVYSKEPLFLSV